MTGIKLTVSETAVSPKGSTETAFEKRFCGYLKDMGIHSHHVSDRYLTGIPDRYVIGGNWIEFKVMDISGKRKVTPLRLFKTEQNNKLTELHEAGDRAWVAVQFQCSIDPIILFLPWHQFKLVESWSLATVELHGWPTAHLRTRLYDVFGLNLSRYSDGWFYDQEETTV